MKKTFLLLSLTTLLFSACRKETINEVTPSVANNNTKAASTPSQVIAVDTIKRFVLDHSTFINYYYQTSFD